MAVYGGVFADSGGMPTLAFLIGFVAVLFSVFSFGIMIQHFPSSGSIFTYVSHVFGKLPGFIAGWLMLLQYLVSPAMVYLIAAIAIHSMLPDVPILALCFGFLIIVAIVSLIGMKTALVRPMRATSIWRPMSAHSARWTAICVPIWMRITRIPAEARTFRPILSVNLRTMWSTIVSCAA